MPSVAAPGSGPEPSNEFKLFRDLGLAGPVERLLPQAGQEEATVASRLNLDADRDNTGPGFLQLNSVITMLRKFLPGLEGP